MAAEVVKYFFPKFVDLHNYIPANSTQQKLSNWDLLNRQDIIIIIIITIYLFIQRPCMDLIKVAALMYWRLLACKWDRRELHEGQTATAPELERFTFSQSDFVNMSTSPQKILTQTHTKQKVKIPIYIF